MTLSPSISDPCHFVKYSCSQVVERLTPKEKQKVSEKGGVNDGIFERFVGTRIVDLHGVTGRRLQ